MDTESEVYLEDRLLHFIDWLRDIHGVELCASAPTPPNAPAPPKKRTRRLGLEDREAVVLDYVNS